MKKNIKDVLWIQCEPVAERDDVVLYKKNFTVSGRIKRAELFVTACGVYCATLNGEKVGMPMAPGFDSYEFRMPYQIYDVTHLLRMGDELNELAISVGRGWYGWFTAEGMPERSKRRSLKAALYVTLEDGTELCIESDGDWRAFSSKCVSSDIYNGEYYDATRADTPLAPVTVTSLKEDELLLLHDGEKICEHERFAPLSAFVTPKGEYVVDFGQEITGYVELALPEAVRAGDVIELSHAEVLDRDGNFYTANYRSAKAKLTYVCRDGAQVYKPEHTFYGFRYIRFDKRPACVDASCVTAIAVYSDIKRTGRIETSSPLLNRLIDNIFWGQKDNFLDVPTDCPQRDERQGWTGDTEVFCRAANYNFDCEKFYARWMRMLAHELNARGHVPCIIPAVWRHKFSAAWSDAATIVPWEVYRAYGDKKFLAEFFPTMKNHVDSVSAATTTPNLWTGGDHYGDWLGLDAAEGSYDGASDHDLIASAYYARSTELTIKAGKELGEDVAKYEELYKNIRATFIATYTPKTQTECILALHFGLTDEKEAVAKRLRDRIVACGRHLETGFVGTPYILHALSENGYTELAYELLLREGFPSWIYSVKCGATTVWEHWDSRNERGDFWSSDMNSFNHYAYGAAIDWIYGVAAGITPAEPGYKSVNIAPRATKKLEYLNVSYETRHGEIKVAWEHKGGKTIYKIKTPCNAHVTIGGESFELAAGEECTKQLDESV